MEFETVTALENPELYYLGAGSYAFVMPDCDVIMTVKFVPAAGNCYRVNTTCKNGTAVADCEIDADLCDIAYPGEYICFVIMPDEGYAFADGGFTARVNGRIWKQCWFVGEFDMDELGLGTVFVYEMVMPEGDVDVTINCAKSAYAGTAAVCIPVTVR